jgi:hypothetical protein
MLERRQRELAGLEDANFGDVLGKVPPLALEDPWHEDEHLRVPPTGT